MKIITIAQSIYRFWLAYWCREHFYNELRHAYIKFKYISGYCIKNIDNTYFGASLIATNNSILYISDKLSQVGWDALKGNKLIASYGGE